MECVELSLPISVLHDPPVLTQTTEIKTLVHERQDDKRRVAGRRRQLLEVLMCDVRCVCVCVVFWFNLFDFS